ENNYNHDIYSELYEWLLSEKTKEEAGRCAKKGSGSISNEGNIRRGYRRVSIEGKRYCFYEVSGCRPIVETLRSDEFISMMILETFLFVFIAIASFFIADKVYNKGKQLEKSRIAFTGGAADELKTPLAVIANQCECILENVAPEKNNEYVRSIYDESMRMSRLVATLLQYNKLMLSDKTIKASENISEIALNELKKYEPLMAKKGITAEADVEENLRIKCNAELVALAIDNFLSNAVKFSPKNGRVELSVKRSRSDVKVRVFNTGDGVPIDDRRHIWEEFYIRESSRNSANNSTGMGLAVCKKIFELHGFSYGFKNKKNGVEFYFSANQ
ncbi:MAG: HAMP domain-containing histidine kinase, partial [Clostridiales bacterium]|nr:HAMP domain-containing histidine kinase [Clostridiales bacterium]